MSQKEYRSCMSKNMGGGRLKGLSKEDRKIEFCTIAKQCSKGMPYEEAREVCLLPKEPKAPKPRKSRLSKGIDPTKLASCISTNLNIQELTAANLLDNLKTAILQCGTVAAIGTRPQTYHRFMTACLKETGGGGDFLTSQKDIKKCQIQWNAKRDAQNEKG